MSKTYLAIQHLKIHNANAMSSPYTIGFPAMTAWLGAMHALERKIHQQGMQEVFFQGLAVSSHQCDVQTYRGPHDYYNSIIGTANPLKKSKKTGEYERPPFIEEARCHLDISLLIEVKGIKPDEEEILLQNVRNELAHMKIAGGDIVSDVAKVRMQILYDDGESERDFQRIVSSLMPGYVLIERRDLTQAEDNQDALDALLQGLQVTQTAEKDENGKVVHWQVEKDIQDGWLVPIAVGFKDLSGAMEVKNQRNVNYEHHFVEPIITLGEFIMPYHLRFVDEMIWRYRYEAEQGLYLCTIDEDEEED